MKIHIKVKPGSKAGPKIEVLPDNSYLIYIRQIAADGKANEAVIDLLSKYFNTAKSNIKILRGHTSKYKVIEII